MRKYELYDKIQEHIRAIEDLVGQLYNIDGFIEDLVKQVMKEMQTKKEIEE